MYNVTSFQLPAVESNGLVHGGQIFILQLCLSIKIKLVILVLLSFFLLITRPFYNMFPINKTNNSLFVFEFGLPVNFPKSVAGLYFFRLYTTPMSDKIEETYFPIGYLVYILCGIPDTTKLFLLIILPQGVQVLFKGYHFVFQSTTFCSPSVFHFHVVTV